MNLRQGILHRYLLREAAGAWVAVTVVLLSIMLATRFARFLSMAASGKLPKELLLEVVALSSTQYLIILIPVSLLLAIMLSLGRLYKDQEMAAMTACGASTGRFYRPFILLAALLSILAGALSFVIGPWAGRRADYLVEDARWLVQFNPFEPGQFRQVGGGHGVFYTDSVSKTGERLGLVFAQIRERGNTSIVTAREGRQKMGAGGEREVELRDGFRYVGEAGQAAFDVVGFGSFRTRVRPPEFIYRSDERKLRRTSELLRSGDLGDRGELHWRLSVPISVFLLALMAVPLSHLAPRQGRYAKLVLGIVVYLIYSNLLGLGQAWVANAVVPPQIGLWWAHGLAASLAAWLIGRREGWLR
jgi:lipopolysaccharide export system permease protein